ncbi:hypothetical protein AB0C59_23600 [Streptomyces sp. NPDC048664]|uniref:hypothetical protein n=1 Tax=Streptomyces sp. NPDC048664 TaxID=3154505 RepID=UPI00342A9623
MATPTPEELFAPVAHDLSACGRTSRLVERSPDGGGPRLWRQLVVDSVPVGYLEFDVDLDTDVQVEIIAGHAQDAVLENLPSLTDSRAWPACRPGHAHPMRLVPAAALDSDSGPRWVCPADPSFRVPVGGHPGPLPQA